MIKHITTIIERNNGRSIRYSFGELTTAELVLREIEDLIEEGEDADLGLTIKIV